MIWHVETYDESVVRTCIAMYLLSKWIKTNTDVTVLLTGEGSDEILGGYVHLKNAPND